MTWVVELEVGRALSSDGVNWEIQLAVQRSLGWGSLNRSRGEHQFYRYGAGSEQDGLAHFRAYPGLDPSALRKSAEGLIAAVCGNTPQRPLLLADHFELWLLDRWDETPIAFLAAVNKRHLSALLRPAEWSAAAPADNGFAELSASPFGDPLAAGCGPRACSDSLEVRVKQRAGSARRAQWFERPSHDDVGDRTSACKSFPELPITEIWASADDARLEADYVARLAPRLEVAASAAAPGGSVVCLVPGGRRRRPDERSAGPVAHHGGVGGRLARRRT